MTMDDDGELAAELPLDSSPSHSEAFSSDSSGEEEADKTVQTSDEDDAEESDFDDEGEGENADGEGSGDGGDGSFAKGFEFETSEDEDGGEATVHSWDLGEARAAAYQQDATGASALTEKIAATLRRKAAAKEAKEKQAIATAAAKHSQNRDEDGNNGGSSDSGEEDAEDEDDSDSNEVKGEPAQLPQKKRKQLTNDARADRTAMDRPASSGASKITAKRPKTATPTATWTDLNLSRPLLRAIKELGFASPTPIQSQAIPAALAGQDVCGSAVTGSGKTAAFILPCLERLIYRPRRVAATRVLVVTPTRELAIQIHAMTGSLGRHTDVRTGMAVGGLSLQVQETAMRTRPDIVVGTPGRLIDLMRNSRSIALEELEVLILDEADR